MGTTIVSTKDLLEKIRYIGESYPKDELDQLLTRHDSIPELIGILELVHQDPQRFLEENRFDHVYAAVLLGQLGSTDAFYPFLHILKLPNDLALELYKEYLVTTAGRILANTYPGDVVMGAFPDLEALFELVNDITLDECIRATGIQAITSLVLQKRISREMIVYYYHDLLQGGLEDESGYVYTMLIDSCLVLNFRGLYDDILEVFAQKKVDVNHISIDDVEEQFREYNPSYANDYLPISEVHKEFAWWTGQDYPENIHMDSKEIID